MKKRNHNWYLRLGDKLMEIIRNRYTRVRIKYVGSRSSNSTKQFRGGSDLDTRFCFPSGTPNQSRIYQEVIDLFYDKLSHFEGEKIIYGLGTNGNVVNAKPEVGGKVSFKLVDCENY